MGCSSDNGCSDGNHCTCGIKSFQSAEDLYKANEVYYVNDKGSSVAIKVMDIDPEPLVLNGHNYYLVKHENGVTPLQAKPKDIQQITRFEERESRRLGAFKRSEYLFKCSSNTSSNKGGVEEVQPFIFRQGCWKPLRPNIRRELSYRSGTLYRWTSFII